MKNKIQGKWTKPYGVYSSFLAVFIIFETAIYMNGGVQLTDSLVWWGLGFSITTYLVTLLYSQKYAKKNYKFWSRPDWFLYTLLGITVLLGIIFLVTLVRESSFGAHLSFSIFAFLWLSILPVKVELCEEESLKTE